MILQTRLFFMLIFASSTILARHHDHGNKNIYNMYVLNEQEAESRLNPLESAKRTATIGLATGFISNLAIQNPRYANAAGIPIAVSANHLAKTIATKDENWSQYVTLMTGYFVGAVSADLLKAFINSFTPNKRN